jgi:hypothetical protein
MFVRHETGKNRRMSEYTGFGAPNTGPQDAEPTQGWWN